ncbi:hypothetical protein DAI22_06g115000 [Oryza sativa Japonica Group]|nr:hypothetical protein DAI22_06g115000 [Oryza sativa Japonica Group]
MHQARGCSSLTYISDRKEKGGAELAVHNATNTSGHVYAVGHEPRNKLVSATGVASRLPQQSQLSLDGEGKLVAHSDPVS